MKKKTLLVLTFVMIGILATGCGSRTKRSTTRTEQGTAALAEQGTTASTEHETTTSTEHGTEAMTEHGTEVSTEQNTSVAGITETQAREIALQDAGVSEDEITGIQIKKEKENGRDIYDVEFYVGQQEYDYEIDMLEGKILEKDYEIETDFEHTLKK